MIQVRNDIYKIVNLNDYVIFYKIFTKIFCLIYLMLIYSNQLNDYLFCLLIVVELVISRVNQDKVVFLKYDFQIFYINSQCKVDVVMKEFIKYVQNDKMGFIVGVLGNILLIVFDFF